MKLKAGGTRIRVASLLLPGLVLFGLFTVYPIIKLFLMSFFEYDFSSLLDQNFIGLQNYREVLGDGTFRTAFVNTIVYTLVTVPGQMIIGLLVAQLRPRVIILNDCMKISRCSNDPHPAEYNG